MKNPEIARCLSSRKKQRTVNPFWVLADTIKEAAVSKVGLGTNVEHGGGVPNCYGYRADSECVGVVAVRTHGRGGRAYLRYAVIAANKITYSGAAAATLGVRAPWDGRMTATRDDYARLRARAWDRGDIRWEERAFGAVYYLAVGYGWRRASATTAAAADGLPAQRAIRAMRRLAPAGWTVVVTPASQGACPSPAWRNEAGEQYHIPATRNLYSVRGSIARAAAAYAARAEQRDAAALAAMLTSGAADGTWVCLADSRRAGNCDHGSRKFAARHNLDICRHYRAGELMRLANGDARYVRAAILAAMRREKQEARQGYAILTDHIAG